MPKRRNYDVAPGCAVEAALNLINGRWKGVILYHLLRDGTLRFNQLQRIAAGCSPRLLSKQLRELEEDGFIHREVFPVVPPKVEYSLTDEGRTVEPLLEELDAWGTEWLKKRNLDPARDTLQVVEAPALI